MNPATIEFKQTSKSFGANHAIRNLNLTMPDTGIVGLIGRNGSGKTTLLNLAASLLLPSEGSVLINGELSQQLSDATVASIGVVPHRPSFVEGFSCAQYLSLMQSFYKTWDQSRVDTLIQEFQLDPNQRIMGLSEGQRQMLSIIVATAHRPRILLMDEPMSNLDPLSRANTVQMLWDLLIDDGVLIVFSSHILTDVEKIADWITCLNSGEASEHDSLDNIRQRFQAWELQDPDRSLDPASTLPGVLECEYNQGSWSLSLSECLKPEVIAFRNEWDSCIQSHNLSLEAIFPHLNPKQTHEQS